MNKVFSHTHSGNYDLGKLISKTTGGGSEKSSSEDTMADDLKKVETQVQSPFLND